MVENLSENRELDVADLRTSCGEGCAGIDARIRMAPN
jgi:hypothetical protein